MLQRQLAVTPCPQVIERFLPAIDKLLSPHGMLFLVLIEANLPDVIFAKLESQGFHCQVRQSYTSPVSVPHVDRSL